MLDSWNSVWLLWCSKVTLFGVAGLSLEATGCLGDKAFLVRIYTWCKLNLIGWLLFALLRRFLVITDAVRLKLMFKLLDLLRILNFWARDLGNQLLTLLGRVVQSRGRIGTWGVLGLGWVFESRILLFLNLELVEFVWSETLLCLGVILFYSLRSIPLDSLHCFVHHKDLPRVRLYKGLILMEVVGTSLSEGFVEIVAIFELWLLF